MLARIWRSRLSWRTTFALTAIGSLTILAAAGIEGTPGTVFALVFLVGWFALLGKMSENEARHVVQLAQRKGTPTPKRQTRMLLFPWWARLCVLVGVLGVTLVAISKFDDGVAALTFVLALAAAWLVERTVIALRD
jgi:hypothetical protein